MKEDKAGFALVLLAYASWGVLPAFWKLLAHVPPEIVMFHRTIWSAVFLGVVLAYKGCWQATLRQVCTTKTLVTLMLTGTLLAVNWFTYIWAITNGQILASSMGYFIAPILSIGLASVVLGEPLSGAQRWGAALMLAGVVTRGVLLGNPPWIALLLAVSFSCYTLLRKVRRIDPVQGLFVENIVMLLPSGLLLTGAHIHTLWSPIGVDNLLFVVSGLLTALPLLWLVVGAQRISLKYVGALQYVTPTLLFLLAIFVYGEPLHAPDLITFPAIWFGVLVFLLGDRLRKLQLSYA